MSKKQDPAFSRSAVEFTAAAAELCKYAERAREIKGDEMLKILQRLLPFLYLKASLIPSLEPYFEDGNEKFVTESDWNRIRDDIRKILGSADDYVDESIEKVSDTATPEPSSISEDMADIYQDLKDFLLLYQTGTHEVMNDALWECRLNFENIWGQKLLNCLRAIHKYIYSGEEITGLPDPEQDNREQRDTGEWFISKRQKDLRGDDN